MLYAPKSGFGTVMYTGCEICGASITVPEGEQVRCVYHTVGSWFPHFHLRLFSTIRKYFGFEFTYPCYKLICSN
jgi:hypothetical protein